MARENDFPATLPVGVERYVSELVRRFEPERVILFGSHSEGSATADSDVDLLVVMDFGNRARDQATWVDRQLEREFPLDLLGRRPEDVRHSVPVRACSNAQALTSPGPPGVTTPSPTIPSAASPSPTTPPVTLRSILGLTLEEFLDLL